MLAHSVSQTLRRPSYLNPICIINQRVRSLKYSSVNPRYTARGSRTESTRLYRKVLPKAETARQHTHDRDSPPCKHDKNIKFQLTRNMSSASGPPFNNLTYYTFRTPNGLKPAIVLEELGLEYKVVPINIMNNTQKEEWYLAINPNGRIPALKDGDMRVFESGAIMLYLADHYDTSETITYKHGTPLYYEMLSWLMFQMGGVGPMQGRCCPEFWDGRPAKDGGDGSARSLRM